MNPFSKSITVVSYPKINLALDILGKAESGYHEIHTVLHELKDPYDEIMIESFGVQKPQLDSIELECNDPQIPIDNQNTAYLAAELFKKQFHLQGGLKISLKKRIPVQSGLGGGSSNAAATLKALATMYGITCCPNNLHGHMCPLYKIALQIGMDCAFFLNGGTAEGKHFGEDIFPLPPLPNFLQIKIIPTDVRISTKWAYENINIWKCAVNEEKTRWLIKALHRGDRVEVINNLHNDFEELVYKNFPELYKKKLLIEENNNHKVILTGTGGCLIDVNVI